MKRYFSNYKTNVITTETDPEARYFVINEAELSKKRIHTRVFYYLR